MNDKENVKRFPLTKGETCPCKKWFDCRESAAIKNMSVLTDEEDKPKTFSELWEEGFRPDWTDITGTILIVFLLILIYLILQIFK